MFTCKGVFEKRVIRRILGLKGVFQNRVLTRTFGFKGVSEDRVVRRIFGSKILTFKKKFTLYPPCILIIIHNF